MNRIWISVCVLLCVICTGPAMSFEGSGTGDFTEKVKVKGCGSYKADGDVTIFRMESGDWFLETPSGALSGTYTT